MSVRDTKSDTQVTYLFAWVFQTLSMSCPLPILWLTFALGQTGNIGEFEPREQPQPIIGGTW